ncbi:MAG: hypothetical protein U9O98_03160 [Asgard group archaeon]|nr:hypothetical protein [Asgard group archaeon]
MSSEQIKKLTESVKTACAKKQEEKATELLEQFIALVEKNNQEAQEPYTHAVITLLESFKTKIGASKVKKYLRKIEEVVTNNPDNKNLKKDYAKVLTLSLIAMSNKGQKRAMNEIIMDLEELAKNNPANKSIQEEYASGLNEIIQFWHKRGNFNNLRECNEKFRELMKKYPDNEKINEELVNAIVIEIDSTRRRNIEKVETLLEEINAINKKLPQNKEIQRKQAKAHLIAINRMDEKAEKNLQWLNKLKSIYKASKDDKIKETLAEGYLTTIATHAKENKEKMDEQLNEFQELVENSKENENLQTIHAQTIFATLQYTDATNTQATMKLINDLKEKAKHYPKNEKIIEIYTIALGLLISYYSQLKEAEETTTLLKQLEYLDNHYPDNKYVQKMFDNISNALKILGYEKEETEQEKEENKFYT